MFFKICLVILYIINSQVKAFGIFATMNNFKYISDEMNALNYQLKDLPPKWIQQHLDHFEPNENKKWNMKYYENLNFFNISGPIYVLIGGEGPLTSSFLKAGLMFELAKETNGAMFASEHRYYGDSRPVNVTNADDFQYLTTGQALADIETFIKMIKLQPTFNNSKVVVVGGSYAGNLAAWMREIYPDLVDAAIASSAPVLAKKDFFEYLEKVTYDYEHYGTDDCLSIVHTKLQGYEDLLKSANGIEQLKKQENICEDCDMSVPENQQYFFLMNVVEFMINAQYGNVDKIKDHCAILNKTENKKTLENNWLQQNKCFTYSFDYMIESYAMKEYDYALAWTYQTCNEYGYYQTTNSDILPFTKNIPLSWYLKICKRLFGNNFDEKRVDKGVDRINFLYGGRNPNVTSVVFVNGELDPWSNLGVLEDLSYQAPAINIPRSSHCRDLFPDKKTDSEELKEARSYIKYLIKSWIDTTNNR